MHWRRIEDDPPPEDIPVLIWLPTERKGRPCAEVAEWSGDCWWTVGGPNAGSDMPEWEPTHWMPMPDPPTDEDGR